MRISIVPLAIGIALLGGCAAVNPRAGFRDIE